MLQARRIRMGRILIALIAVFLTGVQLSGQDTTTALIDEPDEMPSFPGGEEARAKFLTSNLQYPPAAREEGISGTVFISFVIEKDGSVSNTEIKRDVGGGCGAEAMRVVRLMPEWEPGRLNGEPVRVRMVMPISFRLPDEWEAVIEDEPAEDPAGDEIFVIVEDMPSFPGGMDSLYAYLLRHMNYPADAQMLGIEGKVYIGFVVERDGRISGAEVKRGIHPSLDNEALRVVNNMPRWNPGQQRGKAVRVTMILPVSFQLDGKSSERRRNKDKR